MSITVIKRLPKDTSKSGNNQYRAWVRCSCGAEYETGFYSKAKSCKKCFYDSKVVSDSVTQSFVGRVAKVARYRGIDFDISLKEASDLFNRQGGRCVYTGRQLTSQKRGVVNYSLDRIDSNGVYEVTNCQFVFKPVNAMKHTMSDDRFLENVSDIVTSGATDVTLDSPAPRAKQYRGRDFISLEKFNTIRNNATKRGIDFALTIDDVNNQYIRQGGICDYTLRHIKFATDASSTASIDRIDSSGVYSPDNICIVHKEINFMKGSMTEEEFFLLCEEIYQWSVVFGRPNKI